MADAVRNGARELSLGFLTAHPQGAASILEMLPSEESAAYLREIDDAVGGRALTAMQPLSASAILSGMSRKKAASLLLAMDIHGRLRILRAMDDGRMHAILDQMPKSTSRDLARFLKYPEGSVGAWMSSDIAIFNRSADVASCLAELRALRDKIGSVVFVVDDQTKLLGAVELAEILSAPDGAAIETLADADIGRLSPHSRLSSIVALTAWDKALTLPVVDTRSRLLGALHFDRLREGLVSERDVTAEGHVGQIVVHLAEALLVCTAAMLHGHSTKPTLSRPVSEAED